MVGVLGEIQVCGPPELLFDDQGLLQEFEAASQEFVLDLQEVSLTNVHLEWLVDNDKPWVCLNILPPTVAVSDNA